MALKSNFNEAQSMRDVEKQAESLHTKILNSFIRAGEEFVTNARGQGQSHEMGQYKDVTTNLRNSIAYYIFHNKELVHKNEKGSAVENLQEVSGLVKAKGYQLIGIAGKNYASHVESKGYNVISYQADIAVVDLATYLEKLEVISKGSAAQMEETFLP